MSSLAVDFITPKEYLRRERLSEERHEYLDGKMILMPGANRWHNLIVTNILVSLHNQLRRKPYETYASNMRVKVDASGLYTYPDIVVVCDDPILEDDEFDTLKNPTVLIEVLSPSTEAYDRGKKFELFRRLESLTDYVLIAQASPQVEHFRCGEGGQWILTEARGLDAVLSLPSIGCEIPLADIYVRVTFKDRLREPNERNR